MRTVVRKVGNSRGVLIPAAFLTECGVGMEIEMRQEGKMLVIEPFKTYRLGWFDGYQVAGDADAWEENMTLTPTENEDWQW